MIGDLIAVFQEIGKFIRDGISLTKRIGASRALLWQYKECAARVPVRMGLMEGLHHPNGAVRIDVRLAVGARDELELGRERVVKSKDYRGFARRHVHAVAYQI